MTLLFDPSMPRVNTASELRARVWIGMAPPSLKSVGGASHHTWPRTKTEEHRAEYHCRAVNSGRSIWVSLLLRIEVTSGVMLQLKAKVRFQFSFLIFVFAFEAQSQRQRGITASDMGHQTGAI